MNTGVVATRYARALLKYTAGTGRGEQVYRQVRALLRDPEHPPTPLEPDLDRFVRLLIVNRRTDMLRLIFRTFVSMYLESRGIREASLKTAVPAPELEEKIRALVRQKMGCEIELETTVDPGIVGGFVFELDGRMLDASVRRQIERIRRQFVEKNTRLV